MSEAETKARTVRRGPLAALRRLAGPVARRVRAMRADLRARHMLRSSIRKTTGDLRIVIGSSGTGWDGWISTEYPMFDVTNAASVRRFLRPGSVSAFLAEHVWEHLTPEQAMAAVRNCHAMLRPGGRLRIAVPDGLHPDPEYIEYARPGGTGEGSDDHKVLYTFSTLASLLETAGFKVQLLEWFDGEGGFHFNEWDPSDGLIVRSSRYDDRNRENRTAYTSLIADGIKR